MEMMNRPHESLPEQPMDWKRLLCEREKKERPGRLEKLNATVQRIFPGEEANLLQLRSEIQDSFKVPQMGEYHNEGMFMDTHLEMILENIQKTTQGEFPTEVPLFVRPLLTSTALQYQEVLIRYAFLHDLSKKDCLRVKYADGSSKEVTWSEWQDLIPDKDIDPVALYQWCLEEGITSISYYHNGKDGKHGSAGKKKLEDLGYEGVAPAVLTAIEKHEVAFNFSKVSAKTYQQHLGSLSEEERNLALAGSYLDTLSSLRPNGKPDLSNFLYLLASKQNFEILSETQIKLEEVKGLDPQKVQENLKRCYEMDEPIKESSEEFFQKFLKICQPTEYDLEKVRTGFDKLEEQGFLSSDEKEKALELLREGHEKELGITFGRKMKEIKEVLKNAEKLHL